VEIRRDGELVKTLLCTPGQQGVKYTYAAPAKGNNQYSFTTLTDAGKGVEIKLNTFVGLTTPKAPVITSITEKKQGEVTLAWTAPETDVNGASINPAALAYNIYDGLDEGFVLRENGYTDTEYTFDYGLANGEQAMVMMGVTATFDEEESARAYSDYIFVGTPYTLPHANSFTSLDIAIGADGDDGILWRMLDSFSDPKPQDGDNGYICMIGSMPGQYGELSTGKLDFTNVKAPYISFYTYNYQDDYNELAVIVQDVATGERTTVQKYSLDTLPIGWTQIMCPLDGFSGKIVHVIIGATINTHGYVPVDNLVIDELPAVDLTIKNFSHSSYASAGEKFYVEAVVENHGAKGVDSFTANLLMDGKVIDTVKGDALAAFESAFVVLQGSFSAVSPENSTFNIEIIADGDADLSNNLSDAFNIAFLAPVHPVATGLTATENNGKVVLNWTAPDFSKGAPADVTEDFESYPSFIADLDGFTMYDADGGFPTGISGVSYPMVGQPQAFWTQRSEGEYLYFSTRGACSLVAMATVDSSKRPIPNDDWLISPELYGGRQSISFWACSQTIQYGFETFEVYASSTGTNISDFTKVLYETQVPEEWTKYYVSLPAGTRYFAIRCTSNDCYFFTLDDINYIPEGTPEPLELLGYNVYRNGEKVNDAPVALTTFETERDLAGDDYFVTAVYDKGESTSSNVAHLGEAGIDGIEAEQGSAVYYDLRGIAVSVSDLTPGVYVRRIGSRVEKVVIR
ncbi:MAG: choice-of-anchor J domain-containing protein, partial [Muribaculaceae bacterium]|nr:choice-of-anchor J domain-containing protein [Muribaculaceae bacterium]